MRIGLDPTYPPFEVADDSGVSGLDVDLAYALADELGLQVEFVYFGYDGLYDALATKQVDVLLSALVIMPERRRDFDYSEPYFNAGEILIVPSAEEEIDEMGDLNGRRLAVELGAQGHVEATQWAKRLEDLGRYCPMGVRLRHWMRLHLGRPMQDWWTTSAAVYTSRKNRKTNHN